MRELVVQVQHILQRGSIYPPKGEPSYDDFFQGVIVSRVPPGVE